MGGTMAAPLSPVAASTMALQPGATHTAYQNPPNAPHQGASPPQAQHPTHLA